MIILCSGSVDGRLKDLETRISEWETKAQKKVDWILCTGSFGVWPDYFYMDKPSRKMGGREFAPWYLQQKPFIRRILFVRGAHEDHRWLERRGRTGHTILAPNITWLQDGCKAILEENVSILGLGGVYSGRSYHRRGGKPRGYHRTDVERACASGKATIFLTNPTLEDPGIATIVKATQPELVVTSSRDVTKHSTDATIGHPVIKVSRIAPGDLFGLSVEQGKVNLIG